MLAKSFDINAIMPIAKLRTEIDALMTEKLQVRRVRSARIHLCRSPCARPMPHRGLGQELTPERVKSLMEEVIRVHLGWLIVWGNVFGSLIGLVSVAAGTMPDLQM